MGMRVVSPELLEQFDRFVLGITPQDKVGLFYDDDPDGVCSGSLVATALERIHGKQLTARLTNDRSNYGITEEHVKRFKKAGVTKVITCDNAIEETAHIVDKLAAFADVLEIDNHAICGEFKAKNILMMKPQRYLADMDYAKYCTSKLAYDLFSRHCDLTDRDWVATVGSITDIATEPWMDFIKGVFKKYDIALKKDFFKTDLGKVGIYINDTISFNSDNIDQAFDTVFMSATPQEVLRSPLKKYHAAIEAEIQKFTKAITKDGEWHPELKLVFYHVQPHYRIKSALSTILGLKYPHLIVLLSAVDGDRMTISARCSDKHVAVNRLLQEGFKGLKDAVGGGHVPAAGGSCRPEDYPAFKDRVMKMLREGFTGL